MAYEFVAPKLQSGCVYEISHFHTMPKDDSFKVVPHPVRLFFNSKTIIKESLDVGARIPRHKFYFLDYNNLASRLNDNTILTDVFGHITALQPLEETKVGNERIEVKCDVFIENIRKEEVRITLWVDTARALDVELLQQLPPPVFGAFTSLKVKQFQGKCVLNSTGSSITFLNPDIPELTAYKTTFASFTHAIRILPSSAIQQTKRQHAKKYSVAELNVLDPHAQRGQSIMCEATISHVVLSAGWWYLAYRTCYQKLKFSKDSGWLLCEQKHNLSPLPCFKVSLVIEDPTDEINVMIMGKAAEKLFGISCEHLVNERGCTNPQEFPPEILHAVGKFRLFQLRFGSRNDLLIQAVFHNEAQPAQSSSTPVDQTLPQHKNIETAAHRNSYIEVKVIPFQEKRNQSIEDLLPQQKESE